MEKSCTFNWFLGQEAWLCSWYEKKNTEKYILFSLRAFGLESGNEIF